MNFAAENCLTDKRQHLKLTNIFLMGILFAFCMVTDSHGWGSTERVAPTHNKIVSLALDSLEKDSGFTSGQFPSENRILRNDWVTPTTSGLVGPGPDSDGNSLYSSHYYNPITAEGGAPDAISDQLVSLLLKRILLRETTTDSIGKSAAWSAHYLADMNVPYHVVGTSWKTAFKRKRSSILDSATVKFTAQETGPHKLYNHPRWPLKAGPPIGWGADSNFKLAVETFFFFHSPGSKVDWFDPWYLNGSKPYLPSATTMSLTGSHAVWEMDAAVDITDNQITTRLETIIAKRGQYDHRWKNKRAKWGEKFYEPISIVAKQYAQVVALGTRLEILDIWKNPEIGMANAVWAVSTMYRGSMTSLEPAVSIKSPSAGVHDVIVTLTNKSDINAHNNIDAKFSLNDSNSVEHYIGEIGPNSSGELKFRIEDSSLSNIKGTIEILSDSDTCPDLGYSLRHINIDVDNTGAGSQPEKVDAQEPPEDSDESLPDSPPKPPPTDTDEVKPDTENNNTDIGSTECTDGLIIVGPAKVTFDQGISYTACDRKGNPYPPGIISWSYSDESIASLYTSGNPITGVGFKAGSFVIMARCNGGYYAYLDVEIEEKKDNLFSVSGAEEIKDEKSPFSVSGAEEVTLGPDTDCSHIPGSIAVQGECICTDGLILSPSRGRCVSCDEYYQAVKNAFNDRAFSAAQAMVNEARECSWAAQLQGLINKAEQGQACNTISANLQAACQANNAKAVDGFMAEANQNNCNIDPGLWQWGGTIISAYNQQIKDQRAAQRPQQPKNQTNWMDVINTVVQGVKAVQQQSNPKPSSGPNSPPSVPAQTNNSSNHGGSECTGHGVKCGNTWKAWRVVLDSNNDKICDECRLPYGRGRTVFKNKNDACK